MSKTHLEVLNPQKDISTEHVTDLPFSAYRPFENWSANRRTSIVADLTNSQPAPAAEQETTYADWTLSSCTSGFMLSDVQQVRDACAEFDLLMLQRKGRRSYPATLSPLPILQVKVYAIFSSFSPGFEDSTVHGTWKKYQLGIHNNQLHFIPLKAKEAIINPAHFTLPASASFLRPLSYVIAPVDKMMISTVSSVLVLHFRNPQTGSIDVVVLLCCDGAGFASIQSVAGPEGILSGCASGQAQLKWRQASKLPVLLCDCQTQHFFRSH